MLTDTHCHLDFEVFDQDRDQILDNATQNQVTMIINPGTNIATSKAALQISNTYENVFAAVGIHPNEYVEDVGSTIGVLRKLTTQPNVVAIGEIGLDFYRNNTSHEYQKQLFRSQLELATEVNLPVIIHCREAYEETIRIVKEWQDNGGSTENCGVFHSFSGTEYLSKLIINKGFYIGVTGSITFKNSHDLRQTISKVPLNKLLLETDAPFLSPHPNRGKRNEPGFLHLTAKQVSKLKSTTIDNIAKQITSNACDLFKLVN